MTKRADTRCVVLSCPYNRGDAGTVCDFALFGNDCGYTPKALEWRERGASYPHLTGGNGHDPHPVEIRPGQSLVARVAEARRTGGPASGARQLALAALEVER